MSIPAQKYPKSLGWMVYSKAQKSLKYGPHDIGISYIQRIEDLKKTPKLDFLAFLGSLDGPYSFFNGKFRRYYKKDAGIEQVADFLSWLKINESKIMADIQKRVLSGKIDATVHNEAYAAYLLGFIIGGQYIASKYPPANRGKGQFFPKIHADYLNPNTYDYTQNLLEVDVFPTKSQTFSQDFQYATNYLILGVNSGIHEHTHALLQINNIRHDAPLSELAAFFSQSEHGLPVDISLNFRYGSLLRDWPHMLKERNAGRLVINLVDVFETEYAAFLLGPWIKTYYSGQFDAYDFSTKIMDEPRIIHLYNKEVDCKTFCIASGIKDKELISKLEMAFEMLYEKNWSNPNEFFSIFQDVMDKVFGPARGKYIPKDFANLEYLQQDLCFLNF
ncbi:MAG: hypothetical protein ABIH83_05490 [Candidatus Micrarchaeota archaeon]